MKDWEEAKKRNELLSEMKGIVIEHELGRFIERLETLDNIDPRISIQIYHLLNSRRKLKNKASA